MNKFKQCAGAALSAALLGVGLAAVGPAPAEASSLQRTMKVHCDSARTILFASGSNGTGSRFTLGKCHSTTRVVGSYAHAAHGWCYRNYPSGQVSSTAVCISGSQAEWVNMGTAFPEHPITNTLKVGKT